VLAIDLSTLDVFTQPGLITGSEGAQIAEVEEFAEVEKRLFVGHEKSDAKKLASDFRGAEDEMLK